jgi:putative DNA primase/helicase
MDTTDTAGPVPEHMLAGFDMVHRYTSLDDTETHHVGRIEARGNKRKQFVPITYGVLEGKRGWHKKAPAAPRPLYGLNKLTSMPDAPVLLTEGEKKCEAAQRMFPNYACISWFGGTGQVDNADLTPLSGRRVIIWPDADETGLKARDKLLRRLPMKTTQIVRVDDLPDGFDPWNLERQGCDDPDAWLQATVRAAASAR